MQLISSSLLSPSILIDNVEMLKCSMLIISTILYAMTMSSSWVEAFDSQSQQYFFINELKERNVSVKSSNFGESIKIEKMPLPLLLLPDRCEQTAGSLSDAVHAANSRRLI